MALSIFKWLNTLKSVNKKYVFKSKTMGLVTLDELAQKMAEAGTTVNKVDAVACMELMKNTAEKLVAQGYRVELPLVDVYLAASGTADKKDEHFNPAYSTNDHKLSVHAKINRESQKRIVKAAAYQQEKNPSLE